MFEKAVIFDLDGVLVDTGEAHFRAWQDFAERFSLDFSWGRFVETFGMQNAQVIPVLLGRDASPTEIAELSEWKEQRFRAHAGYGMKVLEGVAELVDDLLRCGFGLAVGTSTPCVNLDFMKEKLEVMRGFDAYVTAEDVQHSKPAPDTFVAAANKLGVRPTRCVVVEDATVGIQAAHAGGMKVIAVTTTRDREELAGADRVVDSLAELNASDFETLIG